MINDFFSNIIYFILEPEFRGILLFVRNIFILVSLLMIVGIIILLIKGSWFKAYLIEDVVETFTKMPYGKKKTLTYWNKIKERINSNREDEYKLAIIEADDLLDRVLEKMGYKGDTLTDKLKQVSEAIIPNIDKVWEAHKLRNNIVHDPDYIVNFDLAKRAIGIYEKTFQDLEVI